MINFQRVNKIAKVYSQIQNIQAILDRLNNKRSFLILSDYGKEEPVCLTDYYKEALSEIIELELKDWIDELEELINEKQCCKRCEKEGIYEHNTQLKRKTNK